MGQKVPGTPQGDKDHLLKDSSPLKFQKSSAPTEQTTSKFSSPFKFQGGSYLV